MVGEDEIVGLPEELVEEETPEEVVEEAMVEEEIVEEEIEKPVLAGKGLLAASLAGIGMIYQEISNSIFLTIFVIVLLLGLLFILLKNLRFRFKKR